MLQVRRCWFYRKTSYLQKTEVLEDADLLRYYASGWDRYTTGANYLNYVPEPILVQARKGWRKEFFFSRSILSVLLSIQDYRCIISNVAGSVSMGKKKSFLHIQKILPNLRLITQRRNGNIIDQGFVKKVVDLFVYMGLGVSGLNKDVSISIRSNLIPFISATEQYDLAENSVPDYLKKAEERFREEENRVERYLHTKTRKELISKCENDSRTRWIPLGELVKISRFRSRWGSTTNVVTAITHPWWFASSEEEVRGTCEGSWFGGDLEIVGEGGANVDTLEPKVYVDALLEVHPEIVNRSFKGEAGFAASLDKAIICYVVQTCQNKISGHSWIYWAGHGRTRVQFNRVRSNSDHMCATCHYIRVLICKYAEQVIRNYLHTVSHYQLLHYLSWSFGLYLSARIQRWVYDSRHSGKWFAVSTFFWVISRILWMYDIPGLLAFTSAVSAFMGALLSPYFLRRGFAWLLIAVEISSLLRTVWS